MKRDRRLAARRSLRNPDWQRAAVFSLTEFPAPRAHVGAIVGMTNALLGAAFKTSLYAFFKPEGQLALTKQLGLHPSVRIGWSSRVVNTIGKLASLAGWIFIVATRRHNLILTRSPIFALAARRAESVIVEFHQAPRTHFRTMTFDHYAVPRLTGNQYRFVFISNALKNIYLREFPHLQFSRSTVAPSGFRREWFPNTWSPSPGHRIVTYAGSLYQGRGIEVVVEVSRQIPDAEFRIIGGSGKAWRELMVGRDVPPNCSHIPHVAPTAIAEYLAQSDVLLAPYEDKVFIASGDDIAGVISPLKVVEYFAAGRATVASDLPAIREIAKDAENALLVPPEDVTAWTEATKELLSNRARRDRLAQHAFNSAQGRLDWDSRLEAILRT